MVEAASGIGPASKNALQMLIQTLTVDNGKEFAGHERLSLRLAMTICFAHPYPSNEREHQQPAGSVLPKEDRLPRHLTPRPCIRDRATQQSTTKKTQLSNSTENSQQSRLCTSDVNSRSENHVINWMCDGLEILLTLFRITNSSPRLIS